MGHGGGEGGFAVHHHGQSFAVGAVDGVEGGLRIDRQAPGLGDRRVGQDVGRAVLELDMTGYPVVVFRNAAHGGLSVVYRRPDGNVGWIDPERTTKSLNGHGSVNGVAS